MTDAELKYSLAILIPSAVDMFIILLNPNVCYSGWPPTTAISSTASSFETSRPLKKTVILYWSQWEPEISTDS